MAAVVTTLSPCCSVYVMSPQTVDERCRPSCDARKFDRGLKTILQDELH